MTILGSSHRLTPKENLVRTIKFSGPEYVPFGMEDACTIYHRDALFYRGNGDDTAVNWSVVWGVQFKRRDVCLGGYPKFHPLQDFENMETYKWPDFHSLELMKEASRVVEKIDRKNHLVIGMNPGLCLYVLGFSWV